MLIWRLLLPPILVFMIWYVYLKVLISRSTVTLSSFVLFPVLFFILAMPHLWWMSVFLAIHANLVFPGLPQGIPLGHALALGFTGLIILRMAIIKQSWGPKLEKRSFLFALGFVLVTLLTIAVRGFGLRVLGGGGGWGGAAYIRLFIAFGFLLATETVIVRPHTWRRFIWILFLATGIPAACQMLFRLSGGEISFQLNFIRPDTWALADNLQTIETQGMVRYFGFAGLAFGLTAVALTRTHRYLTILGLVGALVLDMFSGFRTSITTTLLIVALYMWFASGPRRLHRVTMLITACVLAAILIHPFIRQFPLAVQRALAFIPFYDISPEAAYDADASTQWRLKIWVLMIQNIPKYLLVGKGVLIQDELTSASSMHMIDPTQLAYEWHNYHNGPLGILHDYGALGLVTVLGFLFMSCREFLRWKELFVPGQFMHRYYIFLLVNYLTQVVNFLVLYGDVTNSIPNLIFSAALVRCVVRTQQSQILEDSKLAPASATGSGSPNSEPGTGTRFPLQL